MKDWIVIFFCSISLVGFGQSKETIRILANSRQLENAVFGTKDSLILDKLFAMNLKYCHSNGNIENKSEAIKNILSNRSLYIKSMEPQPYNVSIRNDSAIVSQKYIATEKKVDGTEVKLNLNIELVWVMEKKDWKLIKRTAVKNN